MAKKSFVKKNTGVKVYKYPTAGKDTQIRLDYKTGQFTYGKQISGRINRNGGIIELHVADVDPDFEYLMVQRFRGQDYRTGVLKLDAWVLEYNYEQQEGE